MNKAIAIVDAMREQYAREYGEQRADWQGNVYWAKVEAAAQIVEALERVSVQEDQDAKRYRWLRNSDDARVDISRFDGGWYTSLIGKLLDAAIDAAITKAEP